MYTLDESGYIRVPHDTEMGNKSWIYWHALHGTSTRTDDLDSEELEALRKHIDERNEINQLRNQMKDKLRHQHENMANEDSSIEKAEMETADDNATSPVSESDSPADDRDGGPTDDETRHEADPNVEPLSGLVPQFYIRFDGSSTACNIKLTAERMSLWKWLSKLPVFRAAMSR
jgi:hypothetical protein